MSRLRSLQRIAAIIVKEYKHIWFDPGFFFLAVLAPAVLLTLLSYVFSFDVEQFNLAILNQDQSPRSFEYIRELTASGDIRIIELVQNYDEVLALLREGRVDGALVIPPGFAGRLEARESASVNLVVDASDAGTAFQVINSIQQRTQAYAAGLTGMARAPFEVRIRVWFNPNLNSQHSMIPGLMALVLILPSLAIALGLTRERESGTFESLATTPITGSEYLIGKLIVYISMGVIGTLPALGVAAFWFRVPFRGSVLLYLLLTADYLLATMGFCLLVTRFIASQRTATSIVMLALFIPSFFLTGLILPVDKSSLISRAIAFALPATHFIVISRGIALKALSLSDLWYEALVLFGMGLSAVIVSIFLFTKKLN